MEDLFAPAWARLERAQELPGVIAEGWNAYIAKHPYMPRVLDHGGGVFILRVEELVPPPEEIAVAVGEWLYNIRSSLDYVIWAAAAHASGKVPPPREGVLQYPVYDQQAEWDRNMHRLKPLAEHQRAMLLHMQPFNSDLDANYLRWINRLARLDRHRHLNRVTGRLVQGNPVLALPEGSRGALQWGERVILDGKADLARVSVTPWRSSSKVQINPRVAVDPEIEAWSDSDFWSRIPLGERFRLCQVFVKGEIATYEYDCTGRTRSPEILTDDFKRECDERRSGTRSEPRRQVREVVWGPPLDGQQSSPEKFPSGDPGADQSRLAHQRLLVVDGSALVSAAPGDLLPSGDDTEIL